MVKPEDLKELQANAQNGWEVLATALKSIFGIVVHSAEQAERKLEELSSEAGRHG